MVQGLSDGRQQIDERGELESILVDAPGERVAFDELGHYEARVFLAAADIVDWDNVCMVETGGGPGFRDVSLSVFQSGDEIGPWHFDCNAAIELLVERQVHHAEA